MQDIDEEFLEYRDVSGHNHSLAAELYALVASVPVGAEYFGKPMRVPVFVVWAVAAAETTEPIVADGPEILSTEILLWDPILIEVTAPSRFCFMQTPIPIGEVSAPPIITEYSILRVACGPGAKQLPRC